MATLVNQPLAGGVALSYASAAGGGDKFPAAKNAMLHVKNGSGSSINVTIAAPKTCSFGASSGHDLVFAVAAGVEKILPINDDRYTDSTGFVNVAYSLATTITVAVALN